MHFVEFSYHAKNAFFQMEEQRWISWASRVTGGDVATRTCWVRRVSSRGGGGVLVSHHAGLHSGSPSST